MPSQTRTTSRSISTNRGWIKVRPTLYVGPPRQTLAACREGDTLVGDPVGRLLFNEENFRLR